MISLVIDDAKLVTAIQGALPKGTSAMVVKPNEPDCLRKIYDYTMQITAIVATSNQSWLPQQAWLDLLESIARRVPVVIIGTRESNLIEGYDQHTDLLTWMTQPSPDEIVTVLGLYGIFREPPRKSVRKFIPLYNTLLAVHMLRKNRSLSMLYIDSTCFSKIALEYGHEAYQQLRMYFQSMLLTLWGEKGSFRSRDILCQSHHGSNVYYLLLESARSDMTVPPPGSMEQLSDRLAGRLQNFFWTELYKPETNRILPDFIKTMPDINIGYATALLNPCIDAEDTAQSLIKTAGRVAEIQGLRIKDRRRELIQNLVQQAGLVAPRYQGVFDLKKLTREEIEAADPEISNFRHALVAFESLIRVNVREVDDLLFDNAVMHVEGKNLQPDVLFAIAESINLALELDQACLRQAITNFGNLPGQLLVNILPRNFYYIDRLKDMFPSDRQIVFEVAESEAIKNFGLLLAARERLDRSFKIAIDDFGRGYAGLDRLFKMKPDIIKLDRNLIVDIDKDLTKQTFVSGLIQTAKMTNSTVLAEGVETIEEFEVLKKQGVDLIQGFLLHKPETAEALTNALQ